MRYRSPSGAPRSSVALQSGDPAVPVRSRISPRSNSAMPPKTVSAMRPAERPLFVSVSLKNLADPGVRRLLNRVKQLVAFDGQIEVWADGPSFANPFSHPHVQLRNVERKPRRDRGWNPAIALRYRKIRPRFARPRTAHSELGDLYVSRLARVCRHDSQVALGAVDLEQKPRPVGHAAFQVDRCDRAALEDAAEEHLVGRGHLDCLARLNDLNSLALSRDDAGQLLELPKAEAQRVN